MNMKIQWLEIGSPWIVYTRINSWSLGYVSIFQKLLSKSYFYFRSRTFGRSRRTTWRNSMMLLPTQSLKMNMLISIALFFYNKQLYSNCNCNVSVICLSYTGRHKKCFFSGERFNLVPKKVNNVWKNVKYKIVN